MSRSSRVLLSKLSVQKRLKTVLKGQQICKIERAFLNGGRVEKFSYNPIKGEFSTTLFIAATAAYIATNASTPNSDIKLFDRQGEIRFPILSEVLDYAMSRLGEMTRPLPGHDAFAEFTEDQKLDRMKQLDMAGAFSSYWQDQNDDWDKIRLMHALTERGIIGSYTASLLHPEENNTTYTKLAQANFRSQIGLRPTITYFNTELLRNKDRYCKEVVALFDANFTDQGAQFDTQQIAATAQYQKDIALLQSDVVEYEKLFARV